MGRKGKRDGAGALPVVEHNPSSLVEVMPAGAQRGVAMFSANRLRPVDRPGVSTAEFGLRDVVLVGKPAPQDFVRAYNHPDFAHDFAMLYDTVNGEFLILAPELIDEVGPDAKLRRLYTLVDWTGRVILWPLLAPGAAGRIDPYTRSGHAAIVRAYNSWVRLVAVGERGPIIARESTTHHIEPVWPTDYYALIEKAFAGRVITTADHPLLRRLRGEIPV